MGGFPVNGDLRCFNWSVFLDVYTVVQERSLSVSLGDP